MAFTTKHKDNDKWSNNCAVKDAGGNAGGWWYNACSHNYIILITNRKTNMEYKQWLESIKLYRDENQAH